MVLAADKTTDTQEERPWKKNYAKPHLNIINFRPREKFRFKTTKPLSNQHNLPLAYSPGEAYACDAILKDPDNVALFTSLANLVAW